jgi:hypothetical protein
VKRVVVRYTVKPGRAEENADLVRAVYAELEQTKPAGFHYATFRLEDGLSFVHVAAYEGASPLGALEAFKRFQAGVDDRCDLRPIASQAEEVGSYRFWS